MSIVKVLTNHNVYFVAWYVTINYTAELIKRWYIHSSLNLHLKELSIVCVVEQRERFEKFQLMIN